MVKRGLGVLVIGWIVFGCGGSTSDQGENNPAGVAKGGQSGSTSRLGLAGAGSSNSGGTLGGTSTSRGGTSGRSGSGDGGSSGNVASGGTGLAGGGNSGSGGELGGTSTSRGGASGRGGSGGGGSSGGAASGGTSAGGRTSGGGGSSQGGAGATAGSGGRLAGGSPAGGSTIGGAAQGGSAMAGEGGSSGRGTAGAGGASQGCYVAVKLDQCCSQPVATDQPRSDDPCLVPYRTWYDSSYLEACPAAEQCARLNCTYPAPPSRVAARDSTGTCAFVSECTTPNDCLVATDYGRCCSCPEVLPRALVESDPCVLTQGYPGPGTCADCTAVDCSGCTGSAPVASCDPFGVDALGACRAVR